MAALCDRFALQAAVILFACVALFHVVVCQNHALIILAQHSARFSFALFEIGINAFAKKAHFVGIAFPATVIRICARCACCAAEAFVKARVDASHILVVQIPVFAPSIFERCVDFEPFCRALAFPVDT